MNGGVRLGESDDYGDALRCELVGPFVQVGCSDYIACLGEELSKIVHVVERFGIDVPGVNENVPAYGLHIGSITKITSWSLFYTFALDA
jgi:hypothetical protein